MPSSDQLIPITLDHQLALFGVRQHHAVTRACSKLRQRAEFVLAGDLLLHCELKPEELVVFREQPHKLGPVRDLPGRKIADLDDKNRAVSPERFGQALKDVFLKPLSRCFSQPQRFLSVIPIPAPSMSTNDVSRSGFVVIAST
jgi:hypothetical protein